MPDDLLSGPGSSRTLQEMEPDMGSAEDHTRIYLGVVRSVDAEEKTAAVRTLARCDVICSTERCEGWGRLRAGQLVQLCLHVSGEDEGQTFIQCAAEEGTRAGSLAGSHAPSRQPSRPSSPAGG